jgi:Cu/Ag efflux pump CusA
MILETSTQAKFLIPMAISLAFGIMAATGITLLLIPSLYLILEDFRHMLGFREEKHEKSEEAVR